VTDIIKVPNRESHLPLNDVSENWRMRSVHQDAIPSLDHLEQLPQNLGIGAVPRWLCGPVDGLHDGASQAGGIADPIRSARASRQKMSRDHSLRGITEGLGQEAMFSWTQETKRTCG